MSRPFSYTTPGGAHTSPALPIDHNRSYVAVGLSGKVTGTVSAQIEICYDDVFLVADADRTWFAVTGLTALTANFQGNINYPFTALRIVQASGAGTVKLTIVQAGIIA